MNQKVHNQTVNLIWSIADDVLRDVYTRGKYRDIILPFTVLRRLDVLLVPTKEEALKTYQFLQDNGIDNKSALTGVTKLPFYNFSKFTFETLLYDPSNIVANLENYLDGFSDNVQEIISKFKLRNQLQTMEEAGSGESEIRRFIIEHDYLEAIIGLPKNMFYNTGINTYIWVLSNRKPEHRKGKVQLIDASDYYVKMRKSLGDKSYEFTAEHIDIITNLYLDFKENDKSKIFDNSDFGYHKITVERPLCLKVQFTPEAIEKIKFIDAISEEMQWCLERFGDDVYTNLKQHKELIEKHFEVNDISITPANKKKLLDVTVWKKQQELYKIAFKLLEHFGDEVFMDFNHFSKLFDKALKTLDIKLGAPEKKQIINAVSVRDENAQKVIKKKEKDGTISYEPDAELRDTESIPLKDDIEAYFEAEVLPHVEDAWIDHSKTTVGYEISFTKYFYTFTPLRELDDIAKDIKALMDETQNQLSEIL